MAGLGPDRRQFADCRDVSISSLYRWRRELDGDYVERIDFVELVATPLGSVTPSLDPASIELRLDGATVLIRPGVDAETLATVPSALRSAS